MPRKPSLILLPLVLALASVRAAEVTLTPYSGPGDWVTGAEVSTVNAFSVTNGGAGLGALRDLEQSFTLTRTFTIETIHLTVQDYNPAGDYTISFHQMGGAGANSTNPNDWNTQAPGYTGGQLGATISSFTGEPSVTLTGNHVLSFNLSPEEQPTLAAGEYLIVIRDTSDTGSSFVWRHSNNSSTNYYAGGRYYASSSGIVSQASYRDFGLALVGTASELPIVNPPSGLNVLTGNERALLRWNAPNATGITDYLVEYRVRPDGGWTEFPHAASTATEIAVTGLANGTDYDFRVSTVAQTGTSSPSADVAGEPALKEFLHILSTGQSLSVGGSTNGILSNTQPYDNLMLTGGSPDPYPTSPASPNLPLIPLVEGISRARPQSGPNNGVETPSSGMANFIRGSDPATPRPVVVGLHGLSGSPYSVLKKGAPVPNNEFYSPYNKGMTQAQNARTYIENTLGCTYLPLCVTLIHGENDYVGGLTDLYDANLTEWQSDYEDDLAALTGTARTLPFFINQMNSGNTGEMAVTQFNAHRLHHGKICLVGPKYQYPTTDGTHLTSTSSKAVGEMLGKVIRKVMIEGEEWNPLMPTSVVGSGDTLTVSFHIPVGTLELDTTLVAQRPDFGFEFTQTGGNPVSIGSVELIDGNTRVRITLSDIPTGTDQRLRYAWGYPQRTNSNTVIGFADPTNGNYVGGNLRDQDSSVSPSPTGTGLPLYNWSVAFEEPVITEVEAWRLENFGTTENAGDAADDADPDGDGMVNTDEFVAGTDPNDPADVLRAGISPAAEEDGITISFPAKANLSYAIGYSDSLEADSWRLLPGAVFQESSDTLIEHTDTTAEPRRFYRILTPAP